jgi:hypothetical protein
MLGMVTVATKAGMRRPPPKSASELPPARNAT